MVAASLVGAHLLRNNKDDVSRLASLFHLLFEYYCIHSNPMVLDFIQALRTLAGLGFTACLADKAHIAGYQNYLNRFLNYDQGDFRNHPGALTLLSKTIANMVMLAIQSFRRLPHSGYDKIFIQIIKKIIDNVIIDMAGKRKEAKQIFELLQSKLR